MKTNNSNKAALVVDKARLWSMQAAPFYAQLCMGLQDEFTAAVPTAATNGKVIKWNPDFILGLPERQVRFVLLHETLHCAHGHLWRFPIQFADAAVNMGCDHAINLYLNASKLDIEMPKGGLADPRFKDMAEEEIVRLLRQEKAQQPEQPDPCGGYEKPAEEDKPSKPSKSQDKGDENGDEKGEGKGEDESDGEGDGEGEGEGDSDGDGKGSGKGKGKGKGKGSGGSGGDEDGEQDSAGGDENSDESGEAAEYGKPAVQDEDSLREVWERRLIQATFASKSTGIGSAPGHILRQIERVSAQEIDWRRETAEFVRDVVDVRNDWTRSGRRNAWQKVIYPRRMVDSLGLVVFVRDTSSSITDEAMNQFNAVIESAMAETHCGALVIDCDATIHAEHRLEPGDEVPQKAIGGGGTDFCPPFARVNELVDAGEKVAGIVYITDLYGPQPETVDVATLWLCINDQKATTGRTVKIVL